jgi:C4-dicarboxylate-specific signal transduction histidine kinase
LVLTVTAATTTGGGVAQVEKSQRHERHREERGLAPLLACVCEQHTRAVIATFAGGLAHHFNNVLSGVLGLASLASTLERQALGELCGRLRDQVDHTSRVIRVVLTLTRRAENEQQLASTEGRALAEGAVDLAKTAAPAHVAVTADLPAGELWVGVSPVVFGQLLLVGLHAAIEMLRAEETGQVSLSLSRVDGQARLVIGINGSWERLRLAPALSACVGGGQPPSVDSLNRAVIDRLVADSSASLEFVSEGGRELLVALLPAPVVP